MALLFSTTLSSKRIFFLTVLPCWVIIVGYSIITPSLVEWAAAPIRNEPPWTDDLIELGAEILTLGDIISTSVTSGS